MSGMGGAIIPRLRRHSFLSRGENRARLGRNVRGGGGGGGGGGGERTIFSGQYLCIDISHII